MPAQRARANVSRPPLASPETTVLEEAAERGSRRIALSLLAAVRDARDRLDDPADKTALHDFRVKLRRLRSWLRAFRPLFRDTVRGKIERRLARIADVTGASRDLEVHIKWVKRAKRALPESGQPGATWLLHRLRASKRDADAKLRGNLDRYFSKTMRRAERALERYEARVADDGLRFGEVAAELIARQAAELREAGQRVSERGDRAEAHAARIATKRFRYTLEGLGSVGVNIASIVDELERLQDTLGELHDAQQFGGELSTMISLLVSERASRASDNRRARDARSGRARAAIGLRMLLKRLRRAEARSFETFLASRNADWATPHWERLDAVAKSLR